MIDMRLVSQVSTKNKIELKRNAIAIMCKSIDRTYDNVNRLIQVHDNPILIYDGDSGNPALREHVNDIKDSCLHRCCCDWIVGVLPRLVVLTLF